MNTTAHNIRAGLVAGLIAGIGFCFGGQVGLGIALVVILFIQVL